MPVHDDFDSDLKPTPPSRCRSHFPEFGEIARFWPACSMPVFGFWSVWEVSATSTIPILSLEDISFAEQLCSTVIDMVISCTLMYMLYIGKDG